MKLDHVLKESGQPRSASDHAIYYVSGTVEADYDPAYFRVYRNPHNRRSYLLLKKTDMPDKIELREWSKEEAVQAGFAGEKMFRVPLAFGMEVQMVSVLVHKVGVTIPAKAEDGRQYVCCCGNAACNTSCAYDQCTIGFVCPKSSCD